MAASEFSTYNNGLLPDKYTDNATELLAEVYDTTIHLDLVNAKDANGAAFDSTIFGDIISQSKSLFYFKNHKVPNIIV